MGRFLLVSGAALLLGVAVFLLMLRREPEPAAGPRQPGPMAGAAPAKPVPRPEPAPKPKPLPPTPTPSKLEPPPAEPKATAAVPVPPPPPPPPPLVTEDPSTGFTSEDVADAKQKVLVDLGNYRVRAGQEFEIGIAMSAPALEGVMLLMQYDPQLLAYVPDSAGPVGETFRNGIEFYAQQEKGRMILLHRGLPGQRNTNPVTGETIASLRMRALKPGRAQLSYPERSVSFTNALGEDLEYQVSGGRITIR